MITGSRAVLIVIVAFASLVTAQATSPTANKWQAPPDAAAKPNPEAQNPAAPAAGRKLFMHACVNCHGEDGSGGQHGCG
jgi:cytochrome c